MEAAPLDVFQQRRSGAVSTGRRNRAEEKERSPGWVFFFPLL